jgi:hypothetical protein
MLGNSLSLCFQDLHNIIFLDLPFSFFASIPKSLSEGSMPINELYNNLNQNRTMSSPCEK